MCSCCSLTYTPVRGLVVNKTFKPSKQNKLSNECSSQNNISGGFLNCKRTHFLTSVGIYVNIVMLGSTSNGKVDVNQA